jgi:hypothetical protein
MLDKMISYRQIVENLGEGGMGTEEKKGSDLVIML